MTSIIAIEKKFEAILKYSTPIGYISHAVLFFGRFCTVNLLNTLHSDDLREWKCDTAQPGCNQICNNRFSPMSHVRFFNLQIIILTFPRLGFYFCSFWEEATVNEKVKEEKNAKDTYDKAKKKYDDDFKKYEQELKKDENAKLIKPVEPKRPSASLTTTSPKKKKKVQLVTAAKVNEIVWTRKIARLYVVHLLFQLIFEISCLWLLNFLQQFQHNVFGVFVPNVFSVPEEYQCSVGLEGSACSLDQNTIPCFNPRAYDKTIFLWYHIIMCIFSMLLLVADIFYTVQNHIRKKLKKRKEKRDSQKESRKGKLNNQSFAHSTSSEFKDRKLNYW